MNVTTETTKHDAAMTPKVPLRGAAAPLRVRAIIRATADNSATALATRRTHDSASRLTPRGSGEANPHGSANLPISTGTGRILQISWAYCATVSSLEKRAEPAMFSSALRDQVRRSV